MTRETAKHVLKRHGIEFADAGDWLEVLDSGTVNGVPYATWIPCPRSNTALYEWLGY